VENMTETIKRPLRIFLCHSSVDKPKVRKLYRKLQNQGFDPWLDEVNLIGGQDWKIEIPKALANSDAIIICLTKNSIDREGYIQKEIKFALDRALNMPEGQIFIIPVRFEECEAPASLGRYQRVDMFSKGGFEKLLLALVNLAKQTGGELPPPPNLFILFLKRIKTYIFGLEYWIPLTILAIMALVMVILNISKFAEFAIPLPSPSPTPTFTPIVPPTKSAIRNPISSPSNTPTFTPTFTLTPTNTNSPTPFPESIKDNKGVDMILIPDGEFTIGYDKGTDIEKPQDSKLVHAFYIDKFEVTNKLYSECVKTNICQQPHNVNSSTRSIYYGNSVYNDYPVIYVDWYMAKTYCEWRNTRLPTEPEWEKAARGTDGRLYPWGNKIDYSFANYSNYIGDTTKVGSYEIGKSKYGIYDMSGNVSEWTSSLFYYYPYITTKFEDDNNIVDPRVTRGGDWRSDSIAKLRSSYREGYLLYYQGKLVNLDFLGFRCAKSTTP